MVNQKPISARIEYRTLHMLEQESFVTAIPKNEIINRAIRLYVRVNDGRRRYAAARLAEDYKDIFRQLGIDIDRL